MKPDFEKYNPAPEYLESLIAKSGMRKGEVCKALGITTFRYYLADKKSAEHRDAPYAVQFALEGLSSDRAPDASLSDPTPERLRELLDLAGLAQAAAAKALGLAPRTMRYYLSSPTHPQYREAPYTVQYALEALAIEKISSSEHPEDV